MSEKLKKPTAIKSPTKSRARRKRWWRKAHRLIGISSVFFLLLLSVTGVMLNHIDDWFGNDKYVKSGLLLDWYAIRAPEEVYTFRLDLHSSDPFYWADEQLFAGERLVATEIPLPIGTLLHDDLIFIVTPPMLILITESGELVEQIATPERISSAYLTTTGLVNPSLILKGNNEHRFDLDELIFTPNAQRSDMLSTSNIDTSIVKLGFNSEQTTIVRQHRLLQSKVLQDIHSGRIFGPWGVILFDVFAVLFVLLAISGALLWSRGISQPRD